MHFLNDKHINFIQILDQKKNTPEYILSEHLRLNAVYWAVTALDLLGSLSIFEKQDVLDYVLSCQSKNGKFYLTSGGFGGHVGHDPHLLYTLSAIQILAIYDSLELIDQDLVAKCKSIAYLDIASLQNKTDGSFNGDEWGESDSRLSYCGISALSILKRLEFINVEKAAEYFYSCQNFDGGYGSNPGSESHAGLIFCCVGALSILKRQDLIQVDNLGWWLAERQLPCGGLNGRPEKLEDVCYSWWVLASLFMIHRQDWIKKEKLVEFILNSQHQETGGIADRPGNFADVFHTLFGIAGLSMLGFEDLKQVDPRYCMPLHVTKRLGL